MTIPLLNKEEGGWLFAPSALHPVEERGRYAPFLLLIAWYLFALFELSIPGGDPSHAMALAVAILIAVPWNLWLGRLGPGRRARFTAGGVTLLIRMQWSARVQEEAVRKSAAQVELMTLPMGETSFVREMKISAEDWTVTFKISAPLRLEDAEEFVSWLEDNGFRVIIGEQVVKLR